MKKYSYSHSSKIETLSSSEVLANPEITQRLEKFALDAKRIAPKSDDFLYFSIIFMKAAESSVLDDNGEIKKIGNENAWGYFDDNWKWFGNVKPHKNSNCFPPGTKIQLGDGSVKDIEEVCVGDEVISHTGNVRKVLALSKTEYNGKLLKISSRNNSDIFCTPEHPFYAVNTNGGGLRVLSKSKMISDEPEFISADSLKVGDLLVSKRNVYNTVAKPGDLNVDTARLLGIFAAEGCYSKKYGKLQGLNFTIGINERRQSDLIQELFSREFPECQVSVIPNPQRSVINIRVTGYNIAEFFHYHVGEYSHLKKLSKELVFSSSEIKKSFICGWLDGDGCISTCNKLIGITTSANLAYQIRLMLNSLDIPGAVKRISSNNKKFTYAKGTPQKYVEREYKLRDHYRVEICGDAYLKLNLHNDSVKYEFNLNSKIKNYNLFSKNNRFHSISEISQIDYNGFVYNFEVEQDHSYVANGLVVHNCDIFSEIELKKAYKKWIGAPLCVDHKSDSVDGIRGIILDTHYDEKLKQVVGLCALDRVNYPELARKVETGVVRFGSMGTAVEISVCSECGNKAKVASDYCNHVKNRSAWGEINVGLKPIEYSLVVQPAEPGAKLLKCIASIQEHEEEIKNYGVDDFAHILDQLSFVQAEELNQIVKNSCGDMGCSLDERKQLVVGFLQKNGFLKQAQESASDRLKILQAEFEKITNSIAQLHTASSNLDEETKAASMKYLNDSLKSVSKEINELNSPRVSRNPAPEHFPHVEEVPSATGGNLNQLEEQIRAIPATSGVLSPNPKILNNSPSSEATGDVGEPFSTPIGSVEFNSGKTHTAKNDAENLTKFSENDFKSIMEDIMNESRLRKRAELRRRIAYHQGGSEGVEPKDFKPESASKHQDEDKHMHQDKSMGGEKGMFPGDLQEKEKLKRASERQAGLRANAYHQGGAEGVEPSGFKSEPASKHQDEDKHMHQDKSMGGDKGMFPGDAESKKKVSRAAYNGPALRTKFVQARNVDGSLNKSASTFKVFSGDKLVISASAEEIYGDELDQNWDFISSPEYGKEVVSEIRTAGLEYVKNLLKSAQEMPAAPEMAAPAPAMEMPAAPEMAAPAAPKQEIEDRLMDMEDNIEDIRELINQLSDGKEVNVDINVGEEAAPAEAEKLSLSSTVLRQLKLSLAQMDEAADELAMIAETYDGLENLTASQRNDLFRLTRDALNDSVKLAGEASALKKVAGTVAASIVRTAEYVEPVSEVSAQDSETEALIAEAMVLRRNRRNAMLKKAEEMAHENNAAPGLPTDDQKEHHENEASDKKETLEGSKIVIEAPKGEEVKVTVHHEAEKKEEKEEKEEKKEDKADDAMATDSHGGPEGHSAVHKLLQAKLDDAMAVKKASEERETYRLKVRRAYDIGMEMQRKGLIGHTKTALDRQVDEIMEFDDKAFEAFKRTIANAKATEQVKTASDLGGLNVGVESSEAVSTEVRNFADKLSSLWDKSKK